MTKKKTGRGRPAREPQNERGKRIMKHLFARGFSGITAAADAAGVSFDVLYGLVHQEPPPRVLGDTVAKLTCAPLEIPVALVCPALARAS